MAMALPRSCAMPASESFCRFSPWKGSRWGTPRARAPAAARQEVHDRERLHGLAAARLTHQAMGLAALDGERGATHRGGRRAGGAAGEVHFERLDLEQRAHADLAPNRSRRPSPRRLMPSTSTNSATPGIMI